MLEALATSFDLGEDAFHACGPCVGYGFIVPSREEFIDGTLQFIDTAEDTAPNGLLFEFSKPAFDEIEPTGTGRNKVKHEAGPLAHPRAHSRVTMDGIVIEDQVQAGRIELKTSGLDSVQNGRAGKRQHTV